MQTYSVKDTTKMALMAAVVFLLTYTFKIPFVNGYTHLGDCAILIGVMILGRKKGALAGGVGAALSDFISGYPHWIIPTFFIKFLMATVMGLIAEKYAVKMRFHYVVGAIAGGIVQIIGYTACKIFFYGFFQAMLMTPTLILQTIAGIVITVVFMTVFQKSGVLERVKAI